MTERVVETLPDSSSAGNGPWASFNRALTLAQRLDGPATIRTVQTIEEAIMANEDDDEMDSPPPTPSPSDHT